MPASPATLRLMACAESFSHAEEGAIGHDDWPALAALLERELAVVTRLSHDARPATEIDPRLLARARSLHARYVALDSRLARARELATAELAEIAQTGRRLHAVRDAYRSAPRTSANAPLSA